jgi:hypothetical protein
LERKLYGRVLKASFGIRFKGKIEKRIVEDWVDRCHLHIAAILERSDDFGTEKKRNIQKRKKEAAKIDNVRERKVWGDARGAPCL